VYDDLLVGVCRSSLLSLLAREVMVLGRLTILFKTGRESSSEAASLVLIFSLCFSLSTFVCSVINNLGEGSGKWSEDFF